MIINQNSTTSYNYEKEKEFVFSCKGRPFTAMVSTEIESPTSTLIDFELVRDLNIKINLGRHMNKNKNPVSDNACKEFHKELLKIKKKAGPITEHERLIATANMNKRIRQFGMASKEICFKRDMVTNEHKEVDDSKLAGKIKSSREIKHNKTETANNNW